MEKIIVEACKAKVRLDLILAEHDCVNSRSEAVRLIKNGKVLINGSSKEVLAKYKCKIGDLIEFDQAEQIPLELQPVEYPLDILYEDDDLIVVNKPAGMVVHPAAGHYTDTLVNYLLHYGSLSDLGGIERPGIVHRIDKDTSGILVVAKTNQAHMNLAEQFAAHSVKRVYTCLAWGEMENWQGKIDQPLGRHPVNRKKRAIVEDGKRAVTHWKLKEIYPRISLLECRLETGRTHQIRVHLASIGHSLTGDPLYGKFRNFSNFFPEKLLKALKNLDGQALHAGILGFKHPVTGDWMEFKADIPDNLKEVIIMLEQLKNEQED